MTLTENLADYHRACHAGGADAQGELDDQLVALAAIHRLVISADAAQAAEVHLSRRAGATWVQVAAALGISKQAAQQRYGGTRGRAESVLSIGQESLLD